MSEPEAFAPTASQREAIEREEGDVVVAAGAGAGKTWVLTERCLRAVKRGTPVERLLVVTFTESAAHELITRIGKSLRATGAAREQLLGLHRAWISTIHAFCLRVLREHALEARLPPGIRVQDEDETALLERHLAGETVRSSLKDPYVRALVSDYAGGNPDHFVELLLRVTGFLASVPDVLRWVRNARHSLYAEAFPTERYAEFLKEEVASLRHRVKSLSDWVRTKGPGGAKLLGYLEQVEERLGAVLLKDSYSELIAALKAKDLWPSLPRRPSALSKEFWDTLRTQTSSLKKDFQDRLLNTLAHHEALLAEREDLRRKTAVLLRLAWRIWAEGRRRRIEQEALSFSDLEHMAFELLSKPHSEARERLRSAFDQVLVDEFQDVNPVQDSIVRLVGGRGTGNTFVVGDPKQSIYRFRLAEVRLFAGRIKKARTGTEGHLVVLGENFRSRKPLCEFFNSLFSYLMVEDLDGIGFDDTAHLSAARKEPPGDSDFGPPFVEIHLCAGQKGREEDTDGEGELERIEREAHIIAHRLLALKEAGFTLLEGQEKRKVTWSDCALLLRAVKGRVEALSRVLEGYGIAVRGPGTEDPFSLCEVRDLRSLLQVLDNPRQDIPLAALMASPLGGFSMSELAHLRACDREAPFHFLLLDREPPPGRLGEKLRSFRSCLSRWRRMLLTKPLSEVLVRILTEKAYLVYLAGLPLASQRRSNVNGFVERARRFSRFGYQDLGTFLKYLADIAHRGGELAPSGAEETRQDALTITSIHQSKGLQWPVVVLADVGRRFNRQDWGGLMVLDREEGVALQALDPERGLRWPTARYLLIQEKKKRESLAEEMRLLYVACTRAREKLIVVGTGERERIEAALGNPAPGARINPLEAKSARTPLAWLLGAVARLLGRGLERTPDNEPPEIRKNAGGRPFTLTIHTRLPKVPSPQAGEEKEEAVSCDQEAVARAAGIVTFRYPFAEDTRKQAVFTVTELKGREGPEEVPDRIKTLRSVPLPAPSFLTEGDQRQRGITVHRFLEHFQPSCSDLQKEADRLQAAGVLTQAERSDLDLEAVEWFLGTPVGKRLRQAGPSLMREVPFVCRVGPPSEPILIRGVVDAVVETGKKLTLIDYKTDEIGPHEVQARAAGYRTQIAAYAWALQTVWRKQVTEAYLVFLTPRVLHKVPREVFRNSNGLL